MITYPPDGHETDSKSIFFVGSANSSIKINGKPVEIMSNGNFVSTQKLKLGENVFKLEVDGALETRKVIGKRSECSKPVAYAEHYEAFPAEHPCKENVLRSIIVSDDFIRIPLTMAPMYNLERHGSYKYVLDLAGIEMDLDWVHYESTKCAVIIGEVIDAKFPIIFRKPVESVEESYENDYLVLKMNYGSDDFVVCLDAGHGGKQHGSCSPKGLIEKDLNLKVAKLLRAKLEELGASVVMTREDDSHLDLGDRVKIADEAGAKLLLSIHHNAIPDAWDPQLYRGLSTHYYHEQSKPFATFLLDKLVEFTDLQSAGFYRQNLHVLRETTDCAAVLLELGYLIHPLESEIITSEEFQNQASVVIAKAVANFYTKADH